MRGHSKQWKMALYIASAGLCMSAVASDVYRSEQVDGTVRFASQALDASYTLYLKSEPEASVERTIWQARSTTSLSRQATLESLIQHLTQKHGIDINLVRAVIEVESQFNTRAISVKGAVGPMQLMPATALRYGVTRRADRAQNIDAGIHYLKDLLSLHSGNVSLALASYNAGEGAVAKYNRRIPPYRETMLYVPAVLAKMQALHDNNIP